MQAAAEARATGARTKTTRTSIPTQSGKWILGKTIGAGSMGKVKLARKEDGSEQVRSPRLEQQIQMPQLRSFWSMRAFIYFRTWPDTLFFFFFFRNDRSRLPKPVANND